MSLAILFAALLATTAPMADRDIAAPGPQGPLKGSWTGPEGAKTPVVLMIPGSGPSDRDGNSPQGIKAAPLRLLAEGLAAKASPACGSTSAACSPVQARCPMPTR